MSRSCTLFKMERNCLQLPIGIDGIDETYEMCEFRLVNSTNDPILPNIYIIQSLL